MQTPEPLTRQRCRISTLFAAAFLVRGFQSLENGEDLQMTPEGLCSLKSPVLPPLKDLHFCCLKMFPDCKVAWQLFRIDGCRTFATILSTLDELGYDVAWQVLNSKDFGVPNPARECILSDILEADVPAKYFLSQTQMERLLSKSYQGRQGAGSTPQPECPSP